MAVTYHGYNVLKMPGSGGIITAPFEEKDAVCSLERAFQAATIEDPDSKSENPPEVVLKKKKTSPGSRPLEVGNSGGTARSSCFFFFLGVALGGHSPLLSGSSIVAAW